LQNFALKLWLAHGMLSNQPRRFSSISAGNVFSRPSVPRDQLAEPRGILDMDGLHAGNVGSTELAGIEKFLADTQVFRLHFEQFAPEILVDHGFILRGLLVAR
jgi:hypothetical protein